MAISHEDIQVLKAEFDERYVLQTDCDNVQKNMNDKFSRDDKKLAVLDVKMTACLWLMGLIASGLVALVIRVYMG